MIKKIYGSVKRWLYYSVSFELLPLSCSQQNPKGVWRWFGKDPQIQLRNNSHVAFKGYYMLEIEISNLKQSINTCLYANKGANFYEDNLFILPVSRIVPGSKTVKRICYFDSFVDSFRFDPSEESGSCEKLSIKLVKLTEWRAKQLMFSKLEKRSLVNKPNMSTCSSDSRSSLKSIYKAYNQIFSKTNIGSYKNWIEKYEASQKLSSSDVTQQITNLPVNPLISIICPVYNTKPEWLVACIESVKRQLYSNWELILVDDASQDKSHFEALSLYANSDSRIQSVYLEKNSHISAATNAGMRQASGDYVVFLDHDDELAASALLEICTVINENLSVKIIYSDEDLVSEGGERITPHFKSDWNIELLRAHNYVTHLCCYEMTLLKSLGGMRLGYEGAQDYDLILRASAIVETKEIHHIPKILYHWRMVEGSTALSAGAKSYAAEAGLKALSDYMRKIDPCATVVHSSRENFYTVNYSLPDILPKVSIVIPTRDGMEVLKPCIDSLLEKTGYPNYEVIILDNGSEKTETLSFLQKLSKKSNFIVVRDDGEFNYSRINNVAVRHSDGELICMLNNDIEITHKDWLCEMVSIAIRKEVGGVGAKLLYPDGTIQHAGVILGLGGYAAHSHRGLGGDAPGYFCRPQVRQELSAVTGACLLIKRKIYDDVHGLDEAFQVAYNDVDFCLRVQALGYQNIYTPFAELIHHESKTRGDDISVEKIKRFNKEKLLLSDRWGEQLKNDRFYNPNLTRDREDFSIGA